MSSEIIVHEIRKDGEGKVKIPNKMFSINGNSYNKNHPVGIKFVTEYQNILSIFDPKQSENNRLAFDQNNKDHIKQLIDVATKTKNELIKLGEDHLNAMLSSVFEHFNIKMAPTLINVYQNHDHFKATLTTLKNYYVSNTIGAMTFIHQVIVTTMKSRKWRLSAMDEFNNTHNTCFADGRAYGLNNSNTQHCFLNLIGEFSNKNVKEKLATASSAVFNCGWRNAKVEKDATAIGWQEIKKPPGGWPGLTLPLDLVNVTPKDSFWIRFVEPKKKDGAPAQSMEQVLLLYHLSGLVCAAKSMGMLPSDLNNHVQQAYVSDLSTQPFAISQPPPPLQATAGDIAKWSSQPPSLPPFTTDKPAGSQLNVANPDDALAFGTGLPSIGGGNTNTTAKATDLLMAAVPPDEAAARKVIEEEEAAARTAANPASVEARAKVLADNAARDAREKAEAEARAKVLEDNAARDAREKAEAEARTKELADNAARDAEAAAAAASAKELEDNTDPRETDRVGEIRDAVDNAEARNKMKLGEAGCLFFHQWDDGIYTGTVLNSTGKFICVCFVYM